MSTEYGAADDRGAGRKQVRATATRADLGVASYFLEDPPLEPAAPFWEGAAAMVFCFSFLGFLASRLPRCSPLAMPATPVERRQ